MAWPGFVGDRNAVLHGSLLCSLGVHGDRHPCLGRSHCWLHGGILVMPTSTAPLFPTSCLDPGHDLRKFLSWINYGLAFRSSSTHQKKPGLRLHSHPYAQDSHITSQVQTKATVHTKMIDLVFEHGDRLEGEARHRYLRTERLGSASFRGPCACHGSFEASYDAMDKNLSICKAGWSLKAKYTVAIRYMSFHLFIPLHRRKYFQLPT